MGIYGSCTYVSARSILNPAYPTAYSNASIIKSELDNQYGLDNWGIYQLYSRNDQTLKKFKSWKAGNNLWSSSRQKMKKFIYEQLSEGNPVMVPCIYNMATNPNTVNAGHFYLIVGLMLKHVSGDGDYTYGGTGSLVLVKDVWRGGRSDKECEKTLIFNYSHLLSSVWYATQRKYSTNNNYTIRTGSESYSALALTK